MYFPLYHRAFPTHFYLQACILFFKGVLSHFFFVGRLLACVWDADFYRHNDILQFTSRNNYQRISSRVFGWSYRCTFDSSWSLRISFFVRVVLELLDLGGPVHVMRLLFFLSSPEAIESFHSSACMLLFRRCVRYCR